MEDWSANANEAVQISVLQPGVSSPKVLSTFNPQFTYPIFGDEEAIAGYRGLKIHLRFAAHNLLPNVEVTYDERYDGGEGIEPTNIVKSIEPFLPGESFQSPKPFLDKVQNDPTAKDFKPPGRLVDTYKSKGKTFEVWSGDLSDPDIKLLVSRIQVLVSFFIEAGTPLELDDQEWTLSRWKIYFVYEKLDRPPPNASQYSLVGYATSYRFITYIPSTFTNGIGGPTPHDFDFPPTTPVHPDELPSRIRISQFLILPSHHSHGHGSNLYKAIVKTLLASPTCTEITVEDPNEAFDDLRDFCDYDRLSSNGTFAQIKLNTSIEPKLTSFAPGNRVPTSQILDKSLLETLRIKNKIAPRQFYRLVEMYLFSRIANHARQAGTARLTKKGRTTDPDDRAFYYWRLIVKQRVYKQNKDLLTQVDRLERTDKVEQTVGGIVGDYERLLRGMAKWKDAERRSQLEGLDEGSGRPRDKGKRRILDDDEEELEMGEAKRARSELPDAA